MVWRPFWRRPTGHYYAMWLQCVGKRSTAATQTNLPTFNGSFTFFWQSAIGPPWPPAIMSDKCSILALILMFFGPWKMANLVVRRDLLLHAGNFATLLLSANLHVCPPPLTALVSYEIGNFDFGITIRSNQFDTLYRSIRAMPKISWQNNDRLVSRTNTYKRIWLMVHGSWVHHFTSYKWCNAIQVIVCLISTIFKWFLGSGRHPLPILCQTNGVRVPSEAFALVIR